MKLVSGLRHRTPFWPLALVILCLACPSFVVAQTTATLSGTVEDTSNRVIPGAKVTLTNASTGVARTVTTNSAGLYAFPSLVPGTYDIRAAAKGFKAKLITGIVLNAGEARTIPVFTLQVGTETQTVTVAANANMIPIESGAKIEVLSRHDIETLALKGRDTSELLRVLPGVTVQSGGLTQTSPQFNDLNVTVDESAIGSGYDINGAVNRGGTAILFDGADMIDVGDMASALTVIDPQMTQELTTQASNMTAVHPFGPVVVSAISRSGSSKYHGDLYFDARNSVLNANGWQQNHTNTPLGPQHYYYPGGSIGGPVPFTHKKLLFWFGYERWLQNQGNQNILQSYIPTPAMMSGDFSTDNAANNVLCPDGFFQGTPPSGYPGGSWCSDLGGTVLANGTSTVTLPTPPATGTVTIGNQTYTVDNGQKFPAGFLDPGAAALAKIWPKANSNPANIPGGYNYHKAIVNVDNGWIYNTRLDYQFGKNTHIYGMYQQAFSSGLAQGNGAHLYWTPGNAIPYPGGGEMEDNYGKTVVIHLVNTFNPTTTNDFMFAWAYGSYPFTTPNPTAAYRTTLNYPYGKVFSTPSLDIPAYNSAGNETFPDFSQASIFENPPGKYAVRKTAPQFNDTLTKVWGPHTIQVGFFNQITGNFQSSFTYNEDGIMSFSAGQNPDLYNPGNGVIGSPYNATANFVNGDLSSYSENNKAPIGNVAQRTTAFFFEDTWKTTPRLTLDLGIRMEYVGHWYDRKGIGLAVFYPGRVLSDYYAGKYAPGYYWHAIDAGVPLSGQPNRFVYPDARFGMSWDLFGNGSTVLRGGWGMYRFVTQVNTIANGATPEGTARQVLGYGTPGGHRVQMQDIPNLSYKACPSATKPPPCNVQGGQWGLDPTDYGQPMTQAYNFTIDQRLPWDSLLEVAYVGNQSSQLVDAGEDIEGSTYNELANQNKTPVGALFNPDPVTGITATNPENVTEQLDGTMIPNTLADYHPLGIVYGTNATYMIQNSDYADYNGLQASWTKTSGPFIFNFNGTWSKSLATSLQENPYIVKDNYGPTTEDRPLVFNASYAYSSGKVHYSSAALSRLLSGWTVSGISTWQQGGYAPAFFGNGVPNFGNGSATIEQYVNVPKSATANGVTNSLGDPTYFGTDEAIPIMPKLTCNPTNNLAPHQIMNGKCLALPAVPKPFTTSPNGGRGYPYIHMTPYFDNDLAIYRTFHLHEHQQIQLRASAFDWLNHSLLTFANSNYYTANYNVDYASKAITPHFNQGSTGANAFGVMTVRSALPYARVVELDLKYSF